MADKAGRRIKIAHVITRLDWSGAPDVVETICEKLDPSLYETRLISGRTRHPAARTTRFLSEYGACVTVIPELKRRISPISDLAALLRLYLLFRREKFDIVHTHTAKAGFIGRIAARLAGVPAVIHTPHGHNFYGYFSSLGNGFVVILEKMAALFADKIVVFTYNEKEDMIRYGICGGSKIEVIASGIDVARYDNVKADTGKMRSLFDIRPDDPVVGMIGRLESVKGSEYFMDSAGLVAKDLPNAKFIIIGDGSLRQALERRSRELGMGGRIIFTGWRDDIPEILSILDLLVLPSLNEAVGRVILEAGAAAKPVIATAVGGIPAVLKDGETGMIVPPKNPKAMAAAITDLLKDGRKRAAMGSAARQWVKSKFSQESMMASLQDIYRRESKI